ncbi:hypothetical protein L6452_03270 [Arctium lappa]|uniref:Uncharacterized protein n=1 Tax=Arctium lappa TaxID=4217 RepID=A0ACB9FLR8_ARCLA|nr:hypothetical protein L6452_03270 [Arctium lappa]
MDPSQKPFDFEVPLLNVSDDDNSDEIEMFSEDDDATCSVRAVKGRHENEAKDHRGNSLDLRSNPRYFKTKNLFRQAILERAVHGHTRSLLLSFVMRAALCRESYGRDDGVGLERCVSLLIVVRLILLVLNVVWDVDILLRKDLLSHEERLVVGSGLFASHESSVGMLGSVGARSSGKCEDHDWLIGSIKSEMSCGECKQLTLLE